ncbi:MAG: hypothetical protein NDI73_09875 [Desulfuromonadales bacterium]|nr:hypothetical protein [Desulfuromonadales bacterium]
MFKKLILLIIVAGVVYLNYTNPKREDHEAVILAALQERGPVSEDQFAAAMKDVDYSNFMVCSAAKTALDSKLITYGYLKQVKLVNDEWIKQTTQKIQKSQGY